MRQDNCQNIVRPHVAGRRHTTVAGDDFQVFIQQHRIDETKFANRLAYLGYLHPVVQYINNPDFTSSKYPSLESAWGAWNKSGGRVIPGLIKRRDYEFGIYSASAY